MDFARKLYEDEMKKDMENDPGKVKKKFRMLVYGAFGGRIDHTLQSIKTLHCYYLNK